MNKQNIIYSAIAIVIFSLIAIFYCSPLLSNKSIIQPDIVNYRGGAQEMLEYQKKTGENVYWSNAMFSGMPTYQTGARYDYDLIKTIDKTIRFLPRPADYIFLLFTGFFILGLTLFKDWKYALVGSIFFAVGAYFFIIIAAGHNAKVHAIAYFAPLVAGILLLYRGKYILGFLLTALFAGLELSANHPQMTYYLFLVLLVFGIFKLVEAVKNKNIKPFAIASGLTVAAVLIGLGLNATRYMSTMEYTGETTRGKSEMTLLKKTDENSSGLDKSYITHWSYGITETFNLFIPNFMGGASTPKEEDLQNYIKELQTQQYSVAQDEENQQIFQFVSQKPASTYWGDQSFTSGPAYQGAVVVLFFILGLFLVRGKFGIYKWWLLTATILSILLAWGKNFPLLSDFFIDYFPMYNKFRAVSSILVMAEFTMPFLAILSLWVFFKDESLTEDYKKKILYYAGGGTAAFLLILYLFGGSIFSFESGADKDFNDYVLGTIQKYNPNAVGTWDAVLKSLDMALIQDRIDVFKTDTLRTLVLVILSLALLIAYQLKFIPNKIIVIIGIAALALFDGLNVNKRYLNDNNFVSSFIVDNPFPTEVSPRLLSEAQNNPYLRSIAAKAEYNRLLSDLKKFDKTHYRVYNDVHGSFDEANTSYFVSSFGGYHGAKLGKYQDILDLYFSASGDSQKLGTYGEDQMINVLNALNVKYVATIDSTGKPIAQPNQDVNGNAWFVSDIKWVKDANDEILAIKDHDLAETVILREDLYKNRDIKVARDSLAEITLTSYSPMKMVYSAKTNTPQVAVFSEVYYPHGWVATVNGEEQEILKTNYFLRGLVLDKGIHTIEFEFKPQVIKTGNAITLATNILFVLLVAGGIFYGWKQYRANRSEVV